MSLLNEIQKQLKDADIASKVHETADVIIKYVLNYVSDYTEATVFDNSDTPGSRLLQIVENPNNLHYIDISNLTGIAGTFFAMQPTQPESPGKTAQLLSRDMRTFLVIYDDVLYDCIEDIKKCSKDHMADPDNGMIMEIAGEQMEMLNELLPGYHEDISHELVHMYDDVNWEKQREEIKAKTDPFKIRFGADPAEQSVEELNNVIAQTRKDLYSRSEHEARANRIAKR